MSLRPEGGPQEGQIVVPPRDYSRWKNEIPSGIFTMLAGTGVVGHSFERANTARLIDQWAVAEVSAKNSSLLQGLEEGIKADGVVTPGEEAYLEQVRATINASVATREDPSYYRESLPYNRIEGTLGALIIVMGFLRLFSKGNKHKP